MFKLGLTSTSLGPIAIPHTCTISPSSLGAVAVTVPAVSLKNNCFPSVKSLPPNPLESLYTPCVNTFTALPAEPCADTATPIAG